MKKFSAVAFSAVAWLALGTTALAQEAPPPPAPPTPGTAPTPGRPAWRHEVNWSVRQFDNAQGGGAMFTQLGLSLKGVNPDGWFGGIGCYKGLNLVDQTNVDAESHGGLMGGKLWDIGPATLGVGALLGMGYIVSVTPTLGFSNFGAYLVGEPEVSLGWVVTPHVDVTLAASYEATTRPNQVGGPAVSLTLSMVKWGHPHHGW